MIWKEIFYRGGVMLLKPKVSVIVPFFNAEGTIAKCLYSILANKKVSMEIICVNDGSLDNGQKVVEQIRKRHLNIKLFSHKSNKGLFQARLTGITMARGKYIGFVDSDDYVSSSFFTQLYQKAVESDADIVAGRIMNVSSEDVFYIQNRCLDFPYTRWDEHKNLYDLYWQQEGRCYPWHVIWNKLYRRELWEYVYSELKDKSIYLTMMEDFIFSSVILSNVQTFASGRTCVNLQKEFYYYVQSENNMTSVKGNYERWKQNIADMGRAFGEVKNFLEGKGILPLYGQHLEQWKQRYSRYWNRNIKRTEFTDIQKDRLLELLKKSLDISQLEMPDEEDEYYYSEAEFMSGGAEK